VRVYAGIDPLSGKRNYLVDTVPAGPNAAKEAERVRTRLVNQVDEQRNPRTKATVNQLMDRYLALLDVEETTKQRYEDVIRIHVRPLLGELQVGKLDGETLDSVLHDLAQMPGALRRPPIRRAPQDRRARVHGALCSPRLPPTCGLDHPQSPFLPQRRLVARRPLAVDHRQPARSGRTPARRRR
jgi:hypothetical protein